MDDRHIEELLRGSWSPRPPEGMKERVLRFGATAPKHILQRLCFGAIAPKHIARWKLALAGMALAVIALTNAGEYATQTRMASLTNGHSVGAAVRPAGMRDYWQFRRQLDGLLAQSSPGRGLPENTEGGGSL